MAVEFVLNAQARVDAGKGASRRLRRIANMVPAIVYGGDKAPVNIALPHKDLSKALENEAFYSHIIALNVDGDSEQVILKDLQRHPAKPRIVHADFQRVSKDRKITVHVPVHFINEEKCAGVKLQGGMIQHNANEIEVSCLPQDLPEYIEIDMGAMNVGDSVHISDLVLPEGVVSVDLSQGEEHDHTLAVILSPRGGADEDEEAEGEGEADAEGGAPVA